MAAQYLDEEEEAWKCPKHPSRRRRTGICHVCLKERLSSLCPNCANTRPCPCYFSSSSSSASSSSSFCRVDPSGIGSIGRVSSLIESEPSFRRSRSLAVPFLRSKPDSKTSPSLWSLFKSGSGSKSKRVEAENNRNGVVILSEESKQSNNRNSNFEEEEEEASRRRRMMMMRKSRSVAVTSESDVIKGKNNKGKGLGWHFPSPIKAFKQSISRGLIVHERSPLHRG